MQESLSYPLHNLKIYQIINTKIIKIKIRIKKQK